MAAWLVERRLSKTAARLRSLRSELGVIDEQLMYLGDDADDQAIRAMVAETSTANAEARRAREQVEAMRRHRDHVVAEIDDLERRQDELLDQLSAAR